MTKYDAKMTIPAEDFFIPLDLLDEGMEANIDFKPPALKACGFEVTKKRLYHEDLGPRAALRGAVRPVEPNIGSLLVRKDTDVALATVGEQYHTVQNADVYHEMWDTLLPMLPGVALEDIKVTEYSERGGAFNRIDVDFPNYSVVLDQHDGSMTMLHLHVSVLVPHGDSSPRMFVNAKDTQCDNLHPVGEYSSPETRRTESYNFRPITRAFKQDVADFTSYVQAMRGWAKTPLSATKFQGLLHSHQFSQTDKDRLLDHFKDDIAVRGETVWNGVGALTAFATHPDQFYVRGSANSGNTMEALTKRLFRVSKIINSASFREVLN